MEAALSHFLFSRLQQLLPVSGYLAKNTDPVIVPEVSSLAEKRPEAVTEEKRAEPQQEATAAIEKKESATAQPPKRKEARRPSGKDKYQLPIGDSSAKRGGKWSMGVGIGNGGGLPTNGSENFAPRPMTNRVDLMTIMNGAVSIPVSTEKPLGRDLRTDSPKQPADDVHNPPRQLYWTVCT